MTPIGVTRSAGLLACLLLAACTSTDAVLQPSALTTTEQPPAVQTASLGADFRLGFDPVVGATGEATQPLSARLSSLAADNGIPLATPGGAATLSMKGYFSAISENGITTVIYVWDVVDGTGTRLHRIQGQKQATGGSSEGWSGVGADTMEAIADETMNQLVTWLASRQG
ncbi:hypothetical protein GRZ55_13345 [Chelativorans sp. ZYF759]|uniref:hypothetical protein n=1 Tax=Chelativorans sp. ZYF759 TaxID=2692213 RepID=UPI00145EEFD0|nr:hypothetical protein [Chelativorans sp. ZYF759]NMG40229.1 hypothetical protein [Chelativorans sp. ZYF759]